MDIVIPFKKEFESEELRYTLRSIEQNLTGYGQIFLIGDHPEWLTNVTVIEATDFHVKQSSLCNKMMLAARDERVSEKFIRWDDDHFLLKPLNAQDIKYWYSERLSDWEKRARSVYRDVIIRTKEENGDKEYFDVHTPIIIEKEKFLSMQDIVDKKREVLIKSTYCYRAGVEGTDYKERDLKIDAPRVRWEIAKLIHNRLFFSVGEHGMNRQMRIVLEKLYPNKSKYEK